MNLGLLAVVLLACLALLLREWRRRARCFYCGAVARHEGDCPARPPLWLGCLVVALTAAAYLAVVLSLVLGAVVLDGAPHARHRRPGRGACVELAAGPSRLFACEDGRAYLVTLGAWRDAGPLSPVPSVPRDW